MWRVDSVPAVLRPLLWLYGLVAAGALLLVWGVLKLTVRVEHVDRPQSSLAPTIDCVWHEQLMPYFVAAMPFERPYAILNHPAWYMKGVHWFLRALGVKRLCLGSSGHGGRKALESVAPLLREGFASFLNPDGPYGPARQVRDGALELSETTGAWLRPLSVACTAALHLPTWDRKLIPLPFSRVRVHWAKPWVAGASRQEDRERLARELNGER